MEFSTNETVKHDFGLTIFALDIAAIADSPGSTPRKWLGEWIVYVFALYKGTASVYMVGLDVKAVYELGLEAS